jgi:hypothetical protein
VHMHVHDTHGARAQTHTSARARANAHVASTNGPTRAHDAHVAHTRLRTHALCEIFSGNLRRKVPGGSSRVLETSATAVSHCCPHPWQATIGAERPWVCVCADCADLGKIGFSESLARMQEGTGRGPVFVWAGLSLQPTPSKLSTRSTLKWVSRSWPQKRSLNSRAPVMARAPSPDRQAQPRPAHRSQATAAQNHLTVLRLRSVRHSLATGS